MQAATNLAEAFDRDAPPQRIVAEMLDRCPTGVVMTTSFGMEGCALIDMVAGLGQPLTVVYLDTGFLFPETYRLRDRMVERYPQLRFENRGTTLSPEEQAARFGPELWRRDPNTCCRLRKVEPMRAALAGASVWITALTRSQSRARAGIELVQWDRQYQLLKVNPLVHWDRRGIWEYIRSHGVPYNELHERGYPTLGCTHCTLPVPGSSPASYSREGRWSGTTKIECGLHLTVSSER